MSRQRPAIAGRLGNTRGPRWSGDGRASWTMPSPVVEETGGSAGIWFSHVEHTCTSRHSRVRITRLEASRPALCSLSVSVSLSLTLPHHLPTPWRGSQTRSLGRVRCESHDRGHKPGQGGTTDAGLDSAEGISNSRSCPTAPPTAIPSQRASTHPGSCLRAAGPPARGGRTRLQASPYASFFRDSPSVRQKWAPEGVFVRT